MRVFINFWKLKTENSILHVFSFLYKLSFENNFCFFSILNCQTSLLVLKIENCFLKQKIRRKNNYQTYPKHPHKTTILNMNQLSPRIRPQATPKKNPLSIIWILITFNKTSQFKITYYHDNSYKTCKNKHKQKTKTLKKQTY